jgi:group I intron endonuclease
MSAGIYSICNTVNGKIYIGQSYDVERRLRSHFKDLEKNKHINRHLQAAFNKYGKSVFIYTQLLDMDNCNCFNIQDEVLNYYEKYYIKYFNTINGKYGYNKQDGGHNGRPSDETRQKMSDMSFKKGVIQLDRLTGKILNIFKSTRDVKRLLGVSVSHICKRGVVKHKSAGGYMWKHVDDTNKHLKIGDFIEIEPYNADTLYGRKKVLQLDKSTGKILNIFKSRYDVEKIMGYKLNLKKCQHSSHSYKWKYVDDTNKHLKIGDFIDIEPYDINKMFGRKKIIQINITNRTIMGIYTSLSEASYKTKTNRLSITQNLIQKSKSAGGYMWKYVDDTNKHLKIGDFIDIEQYSKKTTGKIVHQINKDNRIILNKFPSAMEAGRILNVNPHNIQSCCINIRKSAGGYMWKYVDDTNKHLKIGDFIDIEQYKPQKRGKNIIQLDKKTNNVLKTFESLHQAANETNTQICSISLCCNGKLKSAGGYIWKFTN